MDSPAKPAKNPWWLDLLWGLLWAIATFVAALLSVYVFEGILMLVLGILLTGPVIAYRVHRYSLRTAIFTAVFIGVAIGITAIVIAVSMHNFRFRAIQG